MPVSLIPNSAVIVNRDETNLAAIAECWKAVEPNLTVVVHSPVPTKTDADSPFVCCMRDLVKEGKLPSVLLVDHRSRDGAANLVLQHYVQTVPPEAPSPAIILLSWAKYNVLEAEVEIIERKMPQFPSVDIYQMPDDAPPLLSLIRRVSQAAIGRANACKPT